MLSNDRQRNAHLEPGLQPGRSRAAPVAPSPGPAGAAVDLDTALAALGVHGVRIAALLGQVDRRLREQVRSDDAFVEQAARYLIDAGGKRLRPLLLALTGHVGPLQDDHRLTDAAVVVELVHLATLHHDDVIDQATVRRDTTSPNRRWNNTVAVLTGDFLFARASALAAELGVEVTLIMAETIAALCEGQMREARGVRGALPPEIASLDATRDHYLAVIDGKTASLIAAACRLGALLSQCERTIVEQLTAYGRYLGTAFQLADDILDITGERAQSGKTPGTDLREGVRTLPVLLALEDAPDGELAGLLAQDALTEADVARALVLLRGSTALERAQALASGYADAARACLGSLPDGRVSRALRQVATFSVCRDG